MKSPLVNKEELVDSIISKCRKGKFICVICSENEKKYIKKELKLNKIPAKRGVYTYKGIIALVPELQEKYRDYFDEVIKWQ